MLSSNPSQPASLKATLQSTGMGEPVWTSTFLKNVFFRGRVSFRSLNCVTYRSLSVPTDRDISTPCRKRINNTRIRELLSLYHTDRNRGREGSLPHYQLVNWDPKQRHLVLDSQLPEFSAITSLAALKLFTSPLSQLQG